MWWSRRNDQNQNELNKRKESLRLEHGWVGRVIYRELCKKFKFNHTNKSYSHNQETFIENEKKQNSLVFSDTNGSSNLSQTTRSWDSKHKKKEYIKQWTFAVPADNRVKLKERESSDGYLDITRELKTY